jgi:hypothetical protein
LGFTLVALPDSGHRLFSFGKDHGPSFYDSIGLVLILIAYAWLLLLSFKRRERLLKYSSSPIFKTGLFLSGIGYGLIIASVMNDFKQWWIAGIAILVIIHAALLFIIFRPAK